MKKLVLLTALSMSWALPAAAFAATGDTRATSTPSAETVPEGESEAINQFVWGGELDTHAQAEVNKPDSVGAKGTAYDDSDLSMYGNYSNWLSMNTDMKLERNRNDNLDDYYPDRNTFFRSEGLTLRQAYLTLRPTDDFAVYGGKIHPNFGSAYDAEPGNFYNFGTDYEQDERIGLGVQYRFAELLGFLRNLKLSLEAYYLDTSALSTSLISGPALDDPTADRVRLYTRGAFGPSNTGSLDSFTAAARGGFAEQGLTYQVSFTREATDDPVGKTELGESIAFTYDPTGDGLPLTDRIGVTPFLEYTHFNNFLNIDNLERHYVVGGLNFIKGRWSLAVDGGLRQSEGLSHDTDHQENVSLNYEIVQHLQLGFGVNHVNIAGVNSWGAGPSLSYEIAF